MNRFVALCLFLAAMAASFSAQAQNVAPSRAIRAFAAAPDSVFAILPHNARLDMIDYHTYDLATPVKNALGNDSRIIESSDSQVLIRVGDVSSFRLVLFEAKGDSLVAVIETVSLPQRDSDITIRRLSDWSIVPQSNSLSISDFTTSATPSNPDLPQVFFKEITYDDDAAAFVFTNTSDSYFTRADRPAHLSTLAQFVKARFDGKRWKIVR